MKKTILLIYLFVLPFIGINAQQVYKGGGSSFSTFLFSYPSYCAKSQCIFLPSDLTNTHSGSITTLYYRYGDVTTQTLNNYTIKMGQTTNTSYVGGNTFFTGLTTVLSSASYTIPAGTNGSWFSINLTTPFVYDATQTLIIQFTFSSVTVAGWGTLGTSNTPTKKIMSPDTLATIGDPTSGTWQDMGFDLAPVGVIPVSPASFALDVFPNPGHDKLIVRIPESNHSRPSEISMMNVLGEEVLKKETSAGQLITFDVADLPRGFYFLKAKLDENEVTRKIILE